MADPGKLGLFTIAGFSIVLCQVGIILIDLHHMVSFNNNMYISLFNDQFPMQCKTCSE